ncbi:MAG: DUF2178 domain-containing protein [Candidatus Buchananbacteria bacterium]|nr:DUF2178 domain-containing protein [Candidatus Buchananbacteria bacterium]
MTSQKFRAIKLIIVIILAILVGQSVVYQNFFVPIIAMAVAILLLFYFRSKVKEIMVDERDNKIAGQAAIVTIRIYAWLSVMAMLIFFASRNGNQTIETVAYVLAYTTCILMLLQVAVFYYFKTKKV